MPSAPPAGQGPAAAPLAAALGDTHWQAVGLVLAVAGGFLLANAILFRHPRALLAEYFGTRRRELHSIREYIWNRVQVHLGFLLLLAGFGVQLYAALRPLPPEAPHAFPTLWAGVVLVATVALECLGWWWSQRLFRRYVRAHLLAHPADLIVDAKLAREIGELFGVASGAEDTVQSYVARLREEVGIPRPDARPEARSESRERARDGAGTAAGGAGPDDDDML